MRIAVAAIPALIGIVAATTLPEAVPTTLGQVYEGVPINEFEEFPIDVIDKEHFVVGYSEDFQNPAWVFYRIGAATDFSTHPSPSFRVASETVSRVKTRDYTNSGFDRGHMAPKFAMGSRYGREGSRSTFVMSNVCPQFHSMNDGQWGDLEEWIAGKKRPNDPTGARFIRGWADEFEELWVVVGPIFDEERETLPSGIPVPNAFFCIVIDEVNGNPRALAFIMDNVDERIRELEPFLTSIDDIEARAGLDFFHRLPDSIEGPLESAIADDLWGLPVNPN